MEHEVINMSTRPSSDDDTDIDPFYGLSPGSLSCGSEYTGLLEMSCSPMRHHQGDSLLQANQGTADSCSVTKSKQGSNLDCASEHEEHMEQDLMNTAVDQMEDCEPLPPENLEMRLAELQSMMCDFKNSFETAKKALEMIQHGDEALSQRINSNKEEHDEKLADVLRMVVQLKTDFSTAVARLEIVSIEQKQLHRKVHVLEQERGLLIDELVKVGVLPNDQRAKFSHDSCDPAHCQCSPASLNSLLAQARELFPGGTHPRVPSEQDSGVLTGRTSDVGQSPVSEVFSEKNTNNDDGISASEGYQDGYQDGYESDSSVTAAANRSLDLSQSLGRHCRTELAALVGNDQGEEGEEQRVQPNKGSPRSMSDESNTESNKISPISKIQGTPRKIAPHEQLSKEGLRQRVCRELLDTERKYCSCLWVLIDHFANQLLEVGILSTEEVMSMFPATLTRLYDLHCGFLQRLEGRLYAVQWQGIIGDVLLQFFDAGPTELFDLYQQYLQEYADALKNVTKACRDDNKFRRFLKVAQKHPTCEGLGLMSFFLTPVQRVPRYVLLLKELRRHTPPEHPDYYHLTNTLQVLKDFLYKLNNSMAMTVGVGQGGLCSSLSLEPSLDTPRHKKKLRMPSFRLSKQQINMSMRGEAPFSRASNPSSYTGDRLPFYRSHPRHLDFGRTTPAPPSQPQAEELIWVPDGTGRYLPIKTDALMNADTRLLLPGQRASMVDPTVGKPPLPHYTNGQTSLNSWNPRNSVPPGFVFNQSQSDFAYSFLNESVTDRSLFPVDASSSQELYAPPPPSVPPTQWYQTMATTLSTRPVSVQTVTRSKMYLAPQGSDAESISSYQPSSSSSSAGAAQTVCRRLHMKEGDPGNVSARYLSRQEMSPSKLGASPKMASPTSQACEAWLAGGVRSDEEADFMDGQLPVVLECADSCEDVSARKPPIISPLSNAKSVSHIPSGKNGMTAYTNDNKHTLSANSESNLSEPKSSRKVSLKKSFKNFFKRSKSKIAGENIAVTPQGGNTSTLPPRLVHTMHRYPMGNKSPKVAELDETIIALSDGEEDVPCSAV